MGSDMAHCILRRAISGKNPQRADMLHMHHVVMRTLTVRSNGRIKRHVANPLATAILLPISAIPVICGYVYRENNLICLGLMFLFFIAFCVAHVALVEKTKTRAHRIKEFTIQFGHNFSTAPCLCRCNITPLNSRQKSFPTH